MSRMVDNILQVSSLSAFYAQSQVLFGVALFVKTGEQVAVLGRNGVGKTTLFRAITATDGVRRSGKIVLDGCEIQHWTSSKIARLGIGYVPQGRRIFPSLTVDEHLKLPQFIKKKSSGTAWTAKVVYEVFPELHRRRRVLAGRLSGGEQTMLAIGRALVCNPKLLLMDEPSEGLSPAVIQRVLDVCSRLKEMSISVLLAEQNLEVARVAQRAYLLSSGKIVIEGETDSLLRSETIGEYLFK